MGIDIATTLVAVACVLLLAQAVWLWRLSRMAGTLRRYEERLEHLADALGLLTEATESGFRAVAGEMERMASARRPAPSKPISVTRMAAAARRGRTPAEIAAAEGLSEGEVALRMHLAGVSRERQDAGRRPRTTKETSDGAMRAK